MNRDRMTRQEMQSLAFDMRKVGYGYEAIAEYLETSTFYAKRLVTEAIEKEKLGTWQKVKNG